METKSEQTVVKKDAHGKIEQQTTETHHVDHDEAAFAKKAKQIEQRFKFKEVLIFLLVLGLGMAAAWGINKAIQDNKNKQNTTATNTIELPNYGTPPNQSGQPQGSSTTRAPESSNGSQQGTQPAPVQPAISKTPEQYHNDVLGFAFTLPVGWTHAIEESSTREIVFYDRLHQNVISSIEVYENSGMESVDSLVIQLSKSPSVSNVHRISINGQDWVEFDSNSGSFNHGIATVRNNRIYYINGELSKPEFASKLNFI